MARRGSDRPAATCAPTRQHRPERGLRILGLDIASNTGAAHSDGYLAKWRLANGTHPGAKLLSLARHLTETYRDHPFDYLAVELSAMGAGKMMKTRGFHDRMLGVVMCFAAAERIVFLPPYNIKRIKKFATGDGNASKEDMVRVAKLEGASVGCDDDLADAYFVLRLAEHELKNRTIFGE